MLPEESEREISPLRLDQALRRLREEAPAPEDGLDGPPPATPDSQAQGPGPE